MSLLHHLSDMITRVATSNARACSLKNTELLANLATMCGHANQRLTRGLCALLRLPQVRNMFHLKHWRSNFRLTCSLRAGTATLPSSACYEHRAGCRLQRGSRTRPRRCLCRRACNRHDPLPSRGVGQARLIAAVRPPFVAYRIKRNSELNSPFPFAACPSKSDTCPEGTRARR